ncbi:MAG: UDP-N-acetylglucosamine 2-epimerase (hydrolyzing) [Planctomycetes bacterium]|nr:UDP-N-acetylglucosamine 2-epimerase (hydrolyzing) [Planctomycetota bacterium]
MKRKTHRRRVAVITGTRAEYGLLRSTMEAIRKHPRLRLQLVVTGMHELRKFGHTIDEILNDGWHVDARVKMQTGRDDPLDQARGLARGVAGIATYLAQADSDLVLVLGDRIEAMAGALAAVTTGRIVAHIHGGDIAPGDFDDSLRHAITKLAHLHLTATPAARRRVIRMGESPDRVHFVGAPGHDRLIQLLDAPNRVASGTRRALIVQHPCGRSPTRERRTMSAILRAVERAGFERFIIYPNSDRGHTGIIQAIDTHRRGVRNGAVRLFRSLDRDSFLRLLIEADLIVGNSSSGIIEAPPAGTPSVNVGSRQQGRQRGGPCVVDADESLESIGAAIDAAQSKRPITGRQGVYGDGTAGRRIAELLASVSLDDAFRRKLTNLARV